VDADGMETNFRPHVCLQLCLFVLRYNFWLHMAIDALAIGLDFIFDSPYKRNSITFFPIKPVKKFRRQQ